MGINGPLDIFIVQLFASLASFIHLKLYYIGVFFILLAIAALNDILTGKFRIGYWGTIGFSFFSLFTKQSNNISNTFSFWTDILILLICGSLGIRLIIAGFSFI